MGPTSLLRSYYGSMLKLTLAFGSGDAFQEWCGSCAFQNDEITMQYDCINPQNGGKTTSSINLGELYTDQTTPIWPRLGLTVVEIMEPLYLTIYISGCRRWVDYNAGKWTSHMLNSPCGNQYSNHNVGLKEEPGSSIQRFPGSD